MTTAGCRNLPRNYGGSPSKLAQMLDRWNGEPGDAVRRYGPSIFPGVPLQMLLAFSANSVNASEPKNSAGQLPAQPVSLSVGWEIGLYQTPAGKDGVAPTRGGSWNRIALSQEFRDLVGRQGYIGDDWDRQIVDQVVIGLIDYRGGRNLVVNRLPSTLRPTNDASQWAVACAIMGYGYGTAVLQVINGNDSTNATQLARVPEEQRFSALLLIAANDLQNGVVYPDFSIKTLVRAWQRFEVGRSLYEATARASNPFFVVDPGENIDLVEKILTERIFGTIGTDCVQQKREIRQGESWSSLTKLVGITLSGALIAGGAYAIREAVKKP